MIKLFKLIFSIVAISLFLIYSSLFIYVELYDFINVFNNEEFRFALRFTFITALISATIIMLVSIPIGYVLSRTEFRFKTFISSIFDVPLILPSIVTGVALLLFFGPVSGHWFNTVGLKVIFTPIGVVVAQVVIGLPLAIRACEQAFSSYDHRYEKVASTFGYTPWKIFMKVSLPMAKMGIISGITMAWARSMGEFGAISIVAGMTKFKTETVSVAIFLNMSIGDIQFSVALSIVMVLISIILLTVLRVIEKKGRGKLYG